MTNDNASQSPLSGSSRLRVLVFRALQLGDMMCAVPSLRAIRAALPGAEVTLVGLPWAKGFAERFRCYIDDFIEFPGFPPLPERKPAIERIPFFLAEVQARRFNLAVQLHGSGRHVNYLLPLFNAQRMAGFFPSSGFAPDPDLFLEYPEEGREVERLLRLVTFLGFPSRGEELEFPITDQEHDRCRRLLHAHRLREGSFVCVHVGARSLLRRWPLERFAVVADALASRGFDVVLTGTNEESSLVNALQSAMRRPAVNLVGRTDLGVLAAMLCLSRGIVCNDTGVSHIAEATRTRSVVLFTGSDPLRWAARDTSLHCAVSGVTSAKAVAERALTLMGREVSRAA